jgi:predicted ATPase/class 3 adenylate cyclase
MADQPRGTVTLLFTDIEGSTRLLHELGPARYVEALGLHRRLLRAAFATYEGYEVDHEGDAFFVAFKTAQGAVAAAAEAQRALAEADWPEGRRVHVRMGIHTGEPALDPPKYVGLDVHMAARIMAAGHGRQTLLSSVTRALVDPELSTQSLGDVRLKDFDEPVALFQLGSDAFPPLKTISNTNLPRPTSSLVGRGQELAEVLALLRSSARLVTLTGPGGAGKTRLALEAAGEVVGDYPGGVFWVGLAPLRDAKLVVDTIAHTLGAKDELARHIGERRMLLLLDNLEQVVDAAPELAHVLEACPNLELLCTSRARLRLSGEREFPVLPLTQSEAIELFALRAQVEPDPDVAEICRRLDHLPLAIELAAARVSVLPPRRLLERLEQRLPILSGGVRDAPERQRTLRATIEWSYDLLAHEDQQLFRRLSVFASGCAIEAAETVCEADLDTLQSLVEKSLVRQTEARFWMFETIREYAGERLLGHSDEAQFRQRHAEYYLALAERVSADDSVELRPRILQQLDDEHENLRTARAWLHETGQADAELRLLCALDDFWDVRGHVREALGYFEAALGSRAPQSPGLRARALAIASDFARDMGAIERARQFSEESLVLFRRAGDEKGVARALHELGETALGAEDYDRATELFEEAIIVARAAGADGAGSIGNLGWTAFLQGDYERAAALAEESVALVRRRGHMSHVAIGLENLAEAELALGRRDAARAHLIECLELAKEAQFVEMTAFCLQTTAELLSTSDPETAACLAGAADLLLERIDVALHPAEQRRRESFRAGLRAALAGSAELQRDRGRQLTADEATELALEKLTAV